MLVKIEARILIFPGTDFHFPSTSVPPGTFLGSGGTCNFGAGGLLSGTISWIPADLTSIAACHRCRLISAGRKCHDPPKDFVTPADNIPLAPGRVHSDSRVNSI